jgi:invasion protein IalB
VYNHFWGAPTGMAGRVFINYRRDDSIATAGRLHDRLALVFGRKNVFMDVDNIPAGADFVVHLNTQVAECDVFLAIIGPRWLDAKDDSGRRRIDNPDDFVTIEIAAALARDIRVIPVMVDGAQMPKAGDLSEYLKPLARRNAVEVRNAQFGRDAEALVEKVREALKDGRAKPSRWRVATAAAAALLLAGWIGLYQIGAPVWVPWTLRTVQPDSGVAEKIKADEDAKRIADAKAKADAEAKHRTDEAEQQRLAALKAEKERVDAKRIADAKAAADAEAKRRADEAEQQRLAALKAEKEERADAKRIADAKAAADAEAKRRADEAEQQRLAALKAQEVKADAEAKRNAAAGQPQQIPLVYSDWTKSCAKNAQDANAKELCQTIKDAHMESGQFVIAAALIETAGDQKKILRLILPNRLLVPPGTRVTIDSNPPTDGPFVICKPEFCMAQHEVTDDFVRKLKAGQTLQIQAINDQKQTVSYLLPLAGFGKAHDGPPKDAKRIPASMLAVLQAGAPLPAAAAQPPQIPLVYSAWVKLCGKNPQDPNAKELCQTMREAHLESGQFVAAAAVIEMAGEQKKIMQLILPTNLLLPPGTRVTIDSSPPNDGPFIICAPEFCMSQLEVTDDFVRKLKAGQTLQIQATNDQKQTVRYTLPLADFGKAHDGPPTDPKVLEEQRKEAQKKRH